MLTENLILDIIAEHYINIGCKIVQKKYTSQKGIDLILKMDKIFIYVEAKGATSSKVGSKNYGNPFSQSQVKTHISLAFFQIISLMGIKSNNDTFIIALPDNENHRKFLEPIKNIIKKLKIKVLLVNHNNKVIEYL